MTITATFFLIAGLGLIAWVFASARAGRFIQSGVASVHSLPSYHGWYAAMWAVVPAILFLLVWSTIAPALGSYQVLESPLAAGLPTDAFERAAILSEARALSHNPDLKVFNDAAVRLAPLYEAADSKYAMIGALPAFLLCFAGGAFAFTRIRPDFRARPQVERTVMFGLRLASLVAILATLGIVASLIFETIRFFGMVSPFEFLFGLDWNPSDKVVDGQATGFGAVPLFWGTVFIGAIIAMLVAIPLGLMSAVYLTQYASANVRKWMKPILEILAGVPTVVYGYFAALTVAPALRSFAVSIGITDASSESALAAGLVMS